MENTKIFQKVEKYKNPLEGYKIEKSSIRMGKPSRRMENIKYSRWMENLKIFQMDGWRNCTRLVEYLLEDWKLYKMIENILNIYSVL